jgi:glucose/arabinose dehydrogenase/peptidoglycan/xylan/chitin deacetylase (PgdA/CDA1 family)
MFTQFVGLSLLIHILIIVSAKVVNYIRKRGESPAFQTYGKGGGVVTSARANAVLSYAILFLVSSYMLLLAGAALGTAYIVGADEPQRVFVRNVFWDMVSLVSAYPLIAYNAIVLLLVVILIFSYERVAQTLPLRWLTRIIDRTHTATLKVSLGAFRMVRSLGERSTNALGTVYTLTIGRPFAVSAQAIFVRVALGIIVSIALFSLPLLVDAQIVEPGFESEEVVAGLTLATAIDHAPDGRIFIAEKGGIVRVVKNGVLLPTPLIALTDVNSFGDRGLLGIAVDPNFATNGYLYLSYTFENTPGLNIAGPKTGRIVRVTVVGDQADESSKFVLVGTVPGDATNPSCENFAVTVDCIPSDSNSHSVGGLRFGPDGKLYATLGDGADFTNIDPRALRAQNVDSLGGKLLRINTDGTAPADNPFYNGNPNANRSKVYALGLRNAFRFNFNETTGRLYLGDVGWSNWEEVNLVSPGANFGWPCREGNGATTYGCTPSSTVTNPLYTYAHNSSGAGSITGGAFASFNAYPDQYDTSFFIGDYAQMWMKRLVLNAAGTAVVSVEDFNVDNVWPVEITAGPDGNVYYLDIVLGSLNRLTHTSGNRKPIVSIGANQTSGLAPLAVTFTSSGTNDPDGNPLTYLWNFGDGVTSALQNPSHTYTTNGAYTPSLTVTDSNGAAVTKSLSVLVGNQKPAATIVSPSSGSLYTELQMLTIQGAGVDPETGTLPQSAYSWQVILHHNTHIHVVQTITGTSTITFPADDHNASDVYMEVLLTVTDPAGLTDTKSINLYLNNGAGSGNLVSNPSLEAEATPAGTPVNWYQGWFGVMNPIFTYPVPGLAGNSAARVQVTSYSSGSARWYFTPAFVTPGAEYTFSDLYTSNVPTELVVQYGMQNGTFTYAYLGSAPAAATPTRYTGSFTVPPLAESATVFHGLVSVGTLTVDDFALALAGTDVISPTAAITSPAGGVTVSGVTPVNVSATDAGGVASAQLLVNGMLTGVPDSEAPFTLSWDTSALPNGTYTLGARVLDTAANEGFAAPITVTVQNAVVGTSTNLFDNGDFEIVAGSYPRSWQPGGWGTHTAVYSYPVPGQTGNGVGITITNYDFDDTGDARWVHAPIPVTSGIRYTYETWYKGTTISDVLGRYRFADGSEHFFGLIKEIPGTTTWTKISGSFVPPVGTVDVTLFHTLSAGGASLQIDGVSLRATGTGTPSEIQAPIVDFVTPLAGAVLSGTTTLVATSSDDTAVVGVFFAVNGSPVGIEDLTAPYEHVLNTRTYPNGTYTLKATTRDPYGNNSNKQIIVTINNTATSTPGSGPNLVPNGSFETAGTGGNPSQWNRGGWGTNTRTFTYPVTGYTGNGARIVVSGYTNGDAKWYVDPITITPGTQYVVSERYNSTVTTSMFARYTKTDGTFQYQALGALPQTGGAWQLFTATMTPPVGVNRVTLFHLLTQNGTLIMDDVSIKGPGTTTPGDTTAPIATVTAPAPSTTVTGTTTVTATATDNVGVVGVTLLIDGNPVGAEDTTAPYSFSWNTASVPNGTHAVSVRARDGAGNVGLSAGNTVTVQNATTTSDTILPTATITAPLGGTTISGLVNIQGTAADNVGLGGVTLFVDGVQEGSENLVVGTSVSFGFDWNTAGVSNGVHTLSVRARDGAGNIGMSPSVSVTVQNGTTTPPQGDNLILNGDFETNGTGGNPLHFNRGGWGTNNRAFAYPVAGASGNGAEIAMTSYTNGDAKWFSDEIPVTPGSQYTFSYGYKATVPTNITVRYTKADGTFSYVGMATPAASAAWTTGGFSFVPPNDAVTVTIMHILTQVGTLTIDNQILTTGNPNTFNRGKVSFSFDDGWLEHYTEALPVLDAAGIDGTFYIVTEEMNNASTLERVQNGKLETASANPGIPEGWSQGGWGTNDRTHTYPVAGKTGNGAEVVITTYTDGDAKWYFEPVLVTENAQYTIGDTYKSTVASQLLIRYTLTDGTLSYVFVDNLPSSNNAWVTVSRNITIPAGVTHVTLFHLIAGVGSLTVDDATVRPVHRYATEAQIQDIYASGHEIGVHTKTHRALSTLTLAEKQDEIDGARQILVNSGFAPVTTIAYPFGDFDTETKQVTESSGLTLGRSVIRGYNDASTDPYALKVQQVDRTQTLADMRGWIDQAAASKTWLILMFHQIDTDPTANLGITPSDFQALVNYAALADVDTITVTEGAPLVK